MLIPMSSPLRLTRAPPELPLLMAASVWMKFSKFSIFKPLRPKAETMPEVTVCPKPNGLPMATAKSPTRSLSESAIRISVRFFALFSLSKATSDISSPPTSSASNSRPSYSLTRIFSAPLMTW
ncbi:Uncharacterised protein [Vibrio cholerae]|nr:Uncharacterised protein [Vibrio cholerae]CSI72361.1 Uncharacterised protein [Vibrio cholerae]